MVYTTFKDKENQADVPQLDHRMLDVNRKELTARRAPGDPSEDLANETAVK